MSICQSKIAELCQHCSRANIISRMETVRYIVELVVELSRNIWSITTAKYSLEEFNLKSDIDRYMREYNLDAIVVLRDEAPNPYNDYLTNRARAGGWIFKKRDQTAVLIVNAM